MPASFFKCKEFTIWQDQSAMKVCTDSCLFGAIVANRIHQLSPSIKNCLDIGTGTGLLSLMVAQQNKNVEIDAIEIDADAALQSKQNVELSPFKNNINTINTSIQEYVLNAGKISFYDFVFTNPPFFEKNLKSIDDKKNIALHNISLGLDELLESITKLLNATGRFAILLPYFRSNYCIDVCKKQGYYLEKWIRVKQSPKHQYFRSILFFSSIEQFHTKTDLCIKDSDNIYTPEFSDLLKDYYLYL